MATDRDSTIDGSQIADNSIKEVELDLTNTPTDGQMIKINMPTGDFTAVDIGNVSDIATMQKNIVLNAFRIAINGSLTQFNMVDGIVDEYEDESGIDTVNSINESYDSVNDLYSPSKESITTSPFLHFKMNDNLATTNVIDSGTGSNDGTASTNTSNLSDTGKINETLHFDDASTEYLTVNGAITDIMDDTTGTWAFWVKLDDILGVNTIAWISDPPNVGEQVSIQTSGSTIYFTIRDNGVIQLEVGWASAPATVGEWHHYVITQNSTTYKLYYDGALTTATGFLGTASDWHADVVTGTLTEFNVGRANSNVPEAYMDGSIDDFRYYSGIALTADEVAILYNSGTGTENQNPEGASNNMTLISNSFTAEAVPSNTRIVLFEEDIDTVTLNTDLKAYATRDAGQTFTTDFATDDKLDITSHGFSNTDRIMVTSSAQDLPSGLDSATVYYVINATTNDFELSLTSGGIAVDITDNGTGTHTAKKVTEITLANDGEYESGKNILTGSVDISAQPSGTSMEYKLITANNKDLKIAGVGYSWD